MEPLLSIQDLSVSFHTDEGVVRAVDHVSFDVMPGETLGLVGESGCGKSVTALSILRLIASPPGRFDSGKILFNGSDILSMPRDALRSLRGRRISMIFQEPMTALSPLQKIERQLIETQQLHGDISTEEARRKAIDWIKRVGIPDAESNIDRYPFQLSGGMRQRVMIAMALMLDPDLIIADEPTTALDVTIQAQIFDLLRTMTAGKTSLLLITHDMGAIWEMCDRVLVMYAAQVVEEGTVRDVFARPAHPYTQGLLRSMPRLVSGGSRLASIPGQVPSPLQYPEGCHFADRCPLVLDRCRAQMPDMVQVAAQQARCFRAGEVIP